MAKVSAIACDLISCESVAKASDDNGVPVNWLQATVTQNGRSVVSGAVFCSGPCLVTYVRDIGDAAPKRRRRTKEQMEAERLAAEASNGDVPEVGTEVSTGV